MWSNGNDWWLFLFVVALVGYVAVRGVECGVGYVKQHTEIRWK